MTTRILYLVTAPQTTGFLRGNLAYMKSRGFEPIVCSSPGDPLTKTAEMDGVEYYEIPMQREIAVFQDIVSLWKLFRLIRKIRPTVVVAATPKAGLLGMVAARIAGVPIRIRILWGLRLETMSGLKRRILWLAEKITSFCSTRYLCDSNSAKEKVIALEIVRREKSGILAKGMSGGIAPDRFQIDTANLVSAVELSQIHHLQAYAPAIGTIGRIVKDKGIAELIEVFKLVLDRYPHARLMIVGEEETGDPIRRENLEWLKQHPNVILTGRCDDIVPLYNLFDVLVFPSFREGFPNVVMEAAAMGVPTVGFQATGVIDAVVDGETGFIVPMKDSAAMADAVLKYLDDPKLRFNHGLNGRKRVVRDFQPPMLWEAYYREYCELLRLKNLPIPVPAVEPETLVLFDTEEDMEEFVTWYAAREVVLKNRNISMISQEWNIDETEIRKVVENVPNRVQKTH